MYEQKLWLTIHKIYLGAIADLGYGKSESQIQESTESNGVLIWKAIDPDFNFHLLFRQWKYVRTTLEEERT